MTFSAFSSSRSDDPFCFRNPPKCPRVFVEFLLPCSTGKMENLLPNSFSSTWRTLCSFFLPCSVHEIWVKLCTYIKWGGRGKRSGIKLENWCWTSSTWPLLFVPSSCVPPLPSKWHQVFKGTTREEEEEEGKGKVNLSLLKVFFRHNNDTKFLKLSVWETLILNLLLLLLLPLLPSRHPLHHCSNFSSHVMSPKKKLCVEKPRLFTLHQRKESHQKEKEEEPIHHPMLQQPKLISQNSVQAAKEGGKIVENQPWALSKGPVSMHVHVGGEKSLIFTLKQRKSFFKKAIGEEKERKRVSNFFSATSESGSHYEFKIPL